MALTMDAPAGGPVLHTPGPYAVRLHLLGHSASTMFTSLLGALLFSLWITLAGVSPITVSAPLLLPVTAMVRGYANAHRHSAGRLLGTPIPEPYRSPERNGVFNRVWTILRDPASWRDAMWLLLHSVVGCATSTLAVTLFAGSVFYLIYPFLFWVTPRPVFSTPFGIGYEVHSVAGATVMMPLALVSFGLWLALQVPLSRLEMALTRSLLSPRRPAP